MLNLNYILYLKVEMSVPSILNLNTVFQVSYSSLIIPI